MTHASHPLVPMSPQQRVAIPPHLTGIAPVLPFHGTSTSLHHEHSPLYSYICHIIIIGLRISGFSQGQDSGIRAPSTSVNYPTQGGIPLSGAIGGESSLGNIEVGGQIILYWALFHETTIQKYT